MGEPVLILGAGLAGWTVARELRKLDATVPVVLVTADSGDFYAKPSLSNAFAQGRSAAQLVTTPAAQMAATLQVELRAHTRALAIDPSARRLRTEGGDIAYGRLVLATGARPIRLPLPGDAAQRVLSVNSLDDFDRLQQALLPGAHVVILGAGLIGCEFANDLAGAGYQVSVVDPSPRPLAALLPPEAGLALRDALRPLGVHWHLGTTAQAVAHDGPHLRVQLADGQQIACDAALSAVGLRPDTALAEAAGLACDRGILVDDALQTSVAGIHALGDAAQYASAGGRTLPYVMPIMNAARTLAAVLAGQPARLRFPLMPVAVKTPALPIVAAPPPPGVDGAWHASGPGCWQYLASDGAAQGFVLTGAQTARRQEQIRLMSAQP